MIKETTIKQVIRVNNLAVTPKQYGKIKKFCAEYRGEWNDHFVSTVRWMTS